MDNNVLGWAVWVGTSVVVFILAGIAAARDLDEEFPVELVLIVGYLAGAIVGFTLAFGSLGEGLGSAVLSLILAVPSVHVLFSAGD